MGGRGVKVVRNITGLVFVASIGISSMARAQCLDLVEGPIFYDIVSCKAVVPKEDFRKDMDYKFYQGMTPKDRATFDASYRGLVVKGKVVKSDAKRVGLDNRKGALLGRTMTLFIPEASALQCPAIAAKRLNGEVAETCCQGSADTPCLLSTSFLLENAKVVGDANSDEGDPERMKAVASPAYVKAVDAFRAKKFTEAAKGFEEVRRAGALDIKGHFLLGLTYKSLDECAKAITPLKVVYDRSVKNKVWADQNDVVRKSNFLLARCYARINQPDRATIILSSYLIEPRKFKAEIEESLKNSDFGWINASKEYRDYSSAARKKLGEIHSSSN